jgi:hypothetical protein
MQVESIAVSTVSILGCFGRCNRLQQLTVEA